MNLCGSGALAMAAKRAQQHNNQKQESLERVLQTHIGNVDIDFITFLCYQHYCRIFKGER